MLLLTLWAMRLTNRSRLHALTVGSGGTLVQIVESQIMLHLQTSEHIGREWLEWSKPMESAHYLGSATQGLGFFHVDVVGEENRSGYMKFLDNYVVLSIEEGFIDEEEIVEGLHKLFDLSW
jgi:hypothetical protein